MTRQDGGDAGIALFHAIVRARQTYTVQERMDNLPDDTFEAACLAAVWIVVNELCAGYETWLRVDPEVRTDRDVVTGALHRKGYARFTVADREGPWHPRPAQSGAPMLIA
jgi:hypothetical protein